MAGHLRKARLRLLRGAAPVANAQRLFDELSLPDRSRERIDGQNLRARVFPHDCLRRLARYARSGRQAAREGDVQDAVPLFEQFAKVRIVPLETDLRSAGQPALSLPLVKIYILRIPGEIVKLLRDRAAKFHRKRKGDRPHILRAREIAVKIAGGIGRNNEFFHILSLCFSCIYGAPLCCRIFVLYHIRRRL